MSFRDISIIIPVRDGSTRIKDKVTLPFVDGKNLLEWKISQLLKIQDADRIFVSTNSPRLKEIATKMGVQIHHRKDILCDGHKASFSEVICGVVSDMPTEHFAWVTVVVPLMSPGDYRVGFELYMANVVEKGDFDSLVSVNGLKEYFWYQGAPLNYKADKHHTISQNLPELFRVTNGLYMRSKTDTLKDGYFLGPKPFMHRVSKISGVDIDEWEDYEMALSLHTFYKGDTTI